MISETHMPVAGQYALELLQLREDQDQLWLRPLVATQREDYVRHVLEPYASGELEERHWLYSGWISDSQFEAEADLDRRAESLEAMSSDCS